RSVRDELVRTGNRFQLGAGLNFEGALFYYADDLVQAERAWSASAEIDHAFARAWNRCGLVSVYLRMGRPADALQEVERVHEITDTDDDWRGIGGMVSV